jgi:hypothetical protein
MERLISAIFKQISFLCRKILTNAVYSYIVVLVEVFMQFKGEELFRYYESLENRNLGNLVRGTPSFPRRHWHELSCKERQAWEAIARPENVIDWRTQ